jgi:hypothetical protein
MGEIDSIYVAGTQCGRVWGVCGGSGEGLGGMSMAGNNFKNYEG